jgi:YggT family protein
MVYLVVMLLDLYGFILLCWLILNWLIRFNIVNVYNESVMNVVHTLNKLIYVPLRFIRKYVPRLNGLDLSMLILLILIRFIRYVVIYYFA